MKFLFSLSAENNVDELLILGTIESNRENIEPREKKSPTVDVSWIMSFFEFTSFGFN